MTNNLDYEVDLKERGRKTLAVMGCLLDILWSWPQQARCEGQQPGTSFSISAFTLSGNKSPKCEHIRRMLLMSLTLSLDFGYYIEIHDRPSNIKPIYSWCERIRMCSFCSGMSSPNIECGASCELLELPSPFFDSTCSTTTFKSV
jgi:hypothetical protein